MIEEGVQQHGVAPGARKMMDNEYIHAEESIQTGLYVYILSYIDNIFQSK